MWTQGTELTTAVTDLINGITAVILMLRMGKLKSCGLRNVWMVYFLMLGLVSLIGFPAHAFVMSAETNHRIWAVLYPCMIAMVLSYYIAVVYDMKGGAAMRIVLRILIPASIAACALLIWMDRNMRSRAFIVFGLWCLILLAGILRILIPAAKHKPVYKSYLAALALLVMGSVIQSMKFIRFTLIFEFNYNGIYHFAIFLLMLVQYRGVCRRIEEIS